MKSATSATPPRDRNLVTRMAVLGRYICLVTCLLPTGARVNRPPLRLSSKDANTLGESKRGKQIQSTVPSVDTSAAVCRSPISP